MKPGDRILMRDGTRLYEASELTRDDWLFSTWRPYKWQVPPGGITLRRVEKKDR